MLLLTFVDIWQNIVRKGVPRPRKEAKSWPPGGGEAIGWPPTSKPERPTRLSSHTFHTQPLLPRICFLLLSTLDFTRPPPCSTSLFGLGADTQRLPECNTTLSCSQCSLSAAPKANHSTTGNDALIAIVHGPHRRWAVDASHLKTHAEKTATEDYCSRRPSET